MFFQTVSEGEFCEVRSNGVLGRSHAARRGGAADRIRLIELIEAHTVRLSAEGMESWEELKFLRESIPDPEEPSRMAREYDIMERIF
jgi:hypothetical protein